MLLKAIKDYIKQKPQIYDIINAIRPINTPAGIWLNKFSQLNNRKINFIQVGANDGLRWDPIRKFIVRDDWSGVLIEPIAPVYNMLKFNYSYLKNKNLFFENCAISIESNEFIDIWSYSDDFLDSLKIEDKFYYLRKSSFFRSNVERHIHKTENIENKIKCYKTKCMTLSSVIKKYFPDNNVDLIFIDAEGHDDVVIKTIDFNKCIPRAIFYESHNLGSKNEEIQSYLLNLGYSLNRLGGDTVAVIN